MIKIGFLTDLDDPVRMELPNGGFEYTLPEKIGEFLILLLISGTPYRPLQKHAVVKYRQKIQIKQVEKISGVLLHNTFCLKYDNFYYSDKSHLY
jgi:hypothetical protein